jgi:hypothetical protein
MEKTISFSVQGREITGTLHGNAHLWTFESENEYIRTNFDEGRISKHANAKELRSEFLFSSIYSRICEEAELPGF